MSRVKGHTVKQIVCVQETTDANVRITWVVG